MNIIEAIQSGKKFKRSTWGAYSNECTWFSREDVLAQDWEIESNLYYEIEKRVLIDKIIDIAQRWTTDLVSIPDELAPYLKERT